MTLEVVTLKFVNEQVLKWISACSAPTSEPLEMYVTWIFRNKFQPNLDTNTHRKLPVVHKHSIQVPLLFYFCLLFDQSVLFPIFFQNFNSAPRNFLHWRLWIDAQESCNVTDMLSHFVHVLLCIVVVWYRPMSPISFRITSLTSWQLTDYQWSNAKRVPRPCALSMTYKLWLASSGVI